MKLKSSIFLISAFFVLVIGLFLAGLPDTALGQGFTYTPLEKIPGASTATTFPQYIQGIYKFGIWTVGIAALFMLSVGGFIYMTSGGNTATLSRAKSYIADALIGLVLALLAYLILFTINPDLVNLSLSKFNDVGGTVSPAPATHDAYTGSTTTGTPWPSDATERALLESPGAGQVFINKPNCKITGNTNCTSVYQLPISTINAVKEMQKKCGCPVVVTGGTEYWLHKTHGPGKTIVDLQRNSLFTNWLATTSYATKKCYISSRPVYELTLPGFPAMYLWDEDSAHFHANTSTTLCK